MHSEKKEGKKMEQNIQISNIITKYDISRDMFTDILFQHGVDRIFFYGVDTSYGNKNKFIHYLPSQNNTFGLSFEKRELYEPLNMIELGCEFNAHVDLNFSKYSKRLQDEYLITHDESKKRILSRIIGIFQPYSIVEIPVLDVNAHKVEINTKGLKEKIADIDKYYEYILTLRNYQEYRKSMFEMGKIANWDKLKKHVKQMDEMLKDLVSVVGEFSKTVSAFLKITKSIGYILLDKDKIEDKFNPLLINLECFHRQASLSALDKIIIR